MEEGRWITINGAHVFVKDGQSPMDAFVRKKSLKQDENIKQQQLEIINKTNPMRDDYHTGIRSINDIKTPEEAFKTKIDDDEDYVYPDFTKEDGKKALKTGKIIVYSSKEIKNGNFVATSKMMAQDYAGSSKIYSKEININDVAWINSGEGQFAKIK